MHAPRAWLRRQLAWSNTRRAWAERLGGLALIVAAAGGWYFGRGWAAEPRVALLGLWLVLFAVLTRRGLVSLAGPVFFYELLRGSRRRVHATRTLYASVLLAALGYVHVIRSEYVREADSLNEQAGMAYGLFLVFFAIQLGIVGVFAPLMVAGAIAEEKERRTLEFVLATDLSGREIVLGKLGARIAGLLLLILAGLPVLSFLQFFGGIDPGELLAAMAVTLVTLFSVAALGIMQSALLRRGRDAIVSTYLILAAYLALSALSQLLRFTGADQAAVTLGGWTVSGSDLLDAFQAGNPFTALSELTRHLESGAAFADVLSATVRDYVIFHAAAGLLALLWAVSRLRPAALGQRGASARRRRPGLPQIGDHPMIWKEVFAEPGPRLHILLKVLVAVLVLTSFYPPVRIFADCWEGLLGVGSPGYGPKGSWPLFEREMNVWVRVMSGLVGTLLLLAVAVRAAGSVTGERARQTLDELLTTPMHNQDIINGKWLGSILGVRRGWLWLGSVYLIGLATGGTNILGVVLAVAAWFAFAACVASVGMWCSVSARTTFEATVLAVALSVLLMGGHWAFCGLLCYLPVGMSGARGSSMEVPIALQAGLTPPFVLGALPIHSLDELAWTAQNGFALVALSVLAGPCVFAISGALLRVYVARRFAERFHRTDLRRPERPLPGERGASAP